MKLTNREILIAAREMIRDPKHWVQHVYENDVGSYCLLGAVIRASHTTHHDSDYWNREPLRTLIVLLNKEAGVPSEVRPSISNIFEWNDVRGRTHEEVLALLNRAIETLPACE